MGYTMWVKCVMSMHMCVNVKEEQEDGGRGKREREKVIMYWDEMKTRPHTTDILLNLHPHWQTDGEHLQFT